MKLAPLSIRVRIQLWHGLLLTCVLAGLSVAAWKLRWNSEVRRMDRDVAEIISLMGNSLRRLGPPRERRMREGMEPSPRKFEMSAEVVSRVRASGGYFVLWARNGERVSVAEEVPDSLLMPKISSAPNSVTSEWSGSEMRVGYLFTPPGECLYVAISTTVERAEMARFGWWLFALSGAVLGTGLWVDSRIVRRAIQPVERIIDAAENISQGDLSTRILSPSSSAELDRLVHVLNKTFANLDEAFAQQARFSADVAHELRTPVSVLIAESQIALERDRSAEDYQETINACLRSSRRMAGLIESLLDLAQISSSEATTRTQCDIALLAREELHALRSLAAAQGIELRENLQHAPCIANAAQIAQVVFNLIHNAIQHNQPAGWVLVETAMHEGKAILRVTNTGSGIPAADFPHIFDRFYRVDPSRNRKTGGVGLGLAICKAIANAHRAELTVESGAGETTVFLMSMK